MTIDMKQVHGVIQSSNESHLLNWVSGGGGYRVRCECSRRNRGGIVRVVIPIKWTKKETTNRFDGMKLKGFDSRCGSALNI